MEYGKINEDVLAKKLASAIDVYISRVDGTPCASTEIHLVKGAENNGYQEENKLLKVFLNGKKKEKGELKRTYPEMYLQFEKIWKLRDMHMRKDLPTKYVFFLACCYQKGCIHELCKKGRPEKEVTWYPGGPSISFFPMPQSDPERSPGCPSCVKCAGTCNGHYLKPQVLFELQTDDTTPAVACPPSNVILATFKKCKKVPSLHIIQETAEKVLLSVEETQMWFEHLNQVALNRMEGARKAAETRKRKKGTAERPEVSIPQTTNDSDETCLVCEMVDPPLDSSEDVPWIACDGCSLWCHVSCANLEQIPNTWLCVNCREIW